MLISGTNLDLIKFMFVSCDFALGSLLCVCSFADVSSFLTGKESVIDVPSSPVSKRTRSLSQDSNSERFMTPLDS